MSKLVILNIGEGNFENGGFPVTLQIGTDGDRPSTEITGRLPSCPEIPQQYEYWRSVYWRLNLGLRLEAPSAQVTNFAPLTDCRQAAEELKISLNQWLNSESFRVVKEKLLKKLKPSDKIRIILQTENPQLRRLPWNLWELLTEDYTQAEIALSALEYDSLETRSPKTKTKKIKILAILGNSEGIDIQKDRTLLEKLPSAEICFLVEPQRQELNEHLWKQGWDIIFFAGHSSSDREIETGKIFINSRDSLTINELKSGLRQAIEKGLKLGIFNSCDGLGLATNLAELHIPELIVMREPVPDKVAQVFLRYFLEAFSGGKSLYLAVREAREKLEGLEDEFPCASWLPVICQNPAAIPFEWRDRSIWPNWIEVSKLVLTSFVATSLVLGIRQAGWLETIELKTFDKMVQLRVDEKEDARLLLVEATQEDIKKYGFPLPDGIIAQVLKKIEQHQPPVIGLDIYRDVPQKYGHAELVKQLQNNRLIVLCQVRQGNDPGIAPPPGVPIDRQTFSDFVLDSDKVVRRHLLVLDPNLNSRCTADYAFSLRLALDYLATQTIKPKSTNTPQIGNIEFKSLQNYPSAYQKTDLKGYQILLNYRSPRNIARRVSITEILTNQFNPNWIKDRIVLIGVTDANTPEPDIHLTPYGKRSGVEIHAQMVSQILSAVLDNRPLLQAWPQWGEVIWIWGWSLIGGVLVWFGRKWLHQGVAIAVAIVTLSGICFILFLQGSWVPLVPSAVALIMTGGSVIVYTAFKSWRWLKYMVFGYEHDNQDNAANT